MGLGYCTVCGGALATFGGQVKCGDCGLPAPPDVPAVPAPRPAATPAGPGVRPVPGPAPEPAPAPARPPGRKR